MRLVITALEKDREMIERTGVKVGKYIPETHEFVDCDADNIALMKLDKLWGVIYWWEDDFQKGDEIIYGI